MGKSRGIVAATASFIALTALLAGCSSGSAPQAASEASTTVAATPAAEASTVAQWASLIAQQKDDWDDWSEQWEDTNCSVLEASLDSGALCRLQLVSASIMTNTTDIEHQLATSPGKKGFIAAKPPAKVAGIFAATRSAAQQARADGEAWSAADCSKNEAEECTGLTVRLDRSIDALQRAFVAWTPYL